MKILFVWTQWFPGIERLDESTRTTFIEFVQTYYAPKFKQGAHYSALSVSAYGSSVRYSNNGMQLYEEIILTSEYKALQEAIHSAWFDDIVVDATINEHISQKIIGFDLVSEEEQQQFLHALMSDFCKNYPFAVKTTQSFQHYLDIQFKPGIFTQANISTFAPYIALKDSIKRDMVRQVYNNIGFLFLLPVNEEDDYALLLQFATIVYSKVLTAEEKTSHLIKIFEIDDNIRIKNLLPNTPGYNQFWRRQRYDSLKSSIYTFWVDFYNEFFGNHPVQKYALSQAFWHKTGFIPETQINSVSEVANVAFINSHADIAWRFRNFFLAIQVPLMPLYHEWFEVIPSEDNGALAVARFLIPIAIAGVIIALSFLLVSSWVAMPAIFELLMIVPATYVGFVVASACIALRDFLYESYQSWFQISEYDASGFQVNDYLRSIFAENDAAMAQTIRDYYVGELKKCDKMSKDTEWSNNQCLSMQQNDYKIKMVERRKILLDEWKKLHNPNIFEPVSKEELQLLVKKRVDEDLHCDRQIDRQKRADYLKEYCHNIGDKSVPLETKHLFFKTQPKVNVYFEENQRQMNGLQTIVTGMHSPSDKALSL